MSYEHIQLETQSGVATITLNRPDVLNAITPKMLKEVRAALHDASEDDDVGVIVLTGQGRAFSSGVDLKSLEEVKPDGGNIDTTMDDLARKVIQAIQKSPKVVIAKVNGFCFTGALELVLACDLIYMAADARLGDTHTKFGLRPSWGMSARLPLAVGLYRAKELSFTARTFTGAEAETWGLANRAVPADQLGVTVSETAKQILANSRESIAAYKVLYNKGGTRHLKKALKFEEEAVFEITDTSERLAEFLHGG